MRYGVAPRGDRGPDSACREPVRVRGMPFPRARRPVVFVVGGRGYFAAGASCFAMIFALIFAYSFFVTTFLLTRSAFDL